MGTIKLTDAEYTAMQLIWKDEINSAAQLSEALQELGWKKSSTYIVLSRLEAKGAIERGYPKYKIKPLVTEEQIQIGEAEEFIKKIFNGSTQKAFACFLKCSRISEKDLNEIQKLIDEKMSESK